MFVHICFLFLIILKKNTKKIIIEYDVICLDYIYPIIKGCRHELSNVHYVKEEFIKEVYLCMYIKYKNENDVYVLIFLIQSMKAELSRIINKIHVEFLFINTKIQNFDLNLTCIYSHDPFNPCPICYQNLLSVLSNNENEIVFIISIGYFIRIKYQLSFIPSSCRLKKE